MEKNLLVDRDLILELVSSVVDGVLSFIQVLVNATLMFKNEWSDKFNVDLFGSLGHWQVQVEKECALNKPVDWKISNDGFRKEFDQVEDGKNDPIGQPLSIIIFRCTFDSFHRNVSRIQEPNEIAEKFSEVTENKIERLESKESEHDMKSFDSSLRFNLG